MFNPKECNENGSVLTCALVSTPYYKEWEMNGNNAVWDLCLNQVSHLISHSPNHLFLSLSLQPYLNGGYENSSRVFANGFDMTTARSAVDVVGILNDAYVGSTQWSVEVALPINMLVRLHYLSIYSEETF